MDQIRNSVNARSLPGSNALYSSSTVSNEQGPLHRRLDVVKNKQGFPHLRKRVRVKKLVHENRIRFGTWNIGTLTGKSMEVVDTMIRRTRLEKRWKGWVAARQLGRTTYLSKCGRALEIEELCGSQLFNEIMRTKKMSDEWRRSTLIPIYNNKGDIQSCANYRGIKLMSHTMKL